MRCFSCASRTLNNITEQDQGQALFEYALSVALVGLLQWETGFCRNRAGNR